MKKGPKNGDGDCTLIVGGAGFIGSWLANALVEQGRRVRVLDALVEQVHGPDADFPRELNPEVETIRGDVRDRACVKRALLGVNRVVHFAGTSGVGQSMYEIEHYTDVHARGTAILLECLMGRPLERLLVASSMSVYGEGLYCCAGDGHTFECAERSREQLQAGDWEPRLGGRVLEPLATPESKRMAPVSVHALAKFDQERLCMMFGEAYRIPTVALRFSNVFGPRQSVSNPYSGVLAIFASRCLNGHPPLIFEDGKQRRDFLNVRDAVHGCLLALDSPAAPGRVFNIGSGYPRSIAQVAYDIIEAVGCGFDAVVTYKHRVGDVRHCYADISQARQLLGYQPQVSFNAGIIEFARWLAGARAQDNFVKAAAELDRRGLTL